MPTRSAPPLFAVIFALVLTGCAGANVPNAKPTSAAPPGVNGVGSAQLAKPFVLDGLTVTVSSPLVGGDTLGPWLSIHVRTSSPYNTPVSGPEVSLVCDVTSANAAWNSGSTYLNGQQIPANGVVEGDLQLLVPGDKRSVTAVPICATPLTVQIESASGKSRADITLDPGLATSLNARRVKQ